MLTRIVVASCFVVCAVSLATAAEDATETKVGDLVMAVPAHWKQQPPANRLRLAQFVVPGEKDQDAELSVFNFGAGGGPAQQIDRWKGQFVADDRQFKATQGKSPQGTYIFVELSGTYNKPVGPPIAGRTERTPDSGMLVVMLAVKDKGHYFLKLVGPLATVKANAESLRNSFGGDAESEMKFEN